MILQTGVIAKIGHYNANKDRILDGMRLQIAKTAERRDLLIDGNEIVEYIHIRQDPDGTWRSAAPERATHIKITVEQEFQYS